MPCGRDEKTNALGMMRPSPVVMLGVTCHLRCLIYLNNCGLSVSTDLYEEQRHSAGPSDEGSVHFPQHCSLVKVRGRRAQPPLHLLIERGQGDGSEGEGREDSLV